MVEEDQQGQVRRACAQWHFYDYYHVYGYGCDSGYDCHCGYSDYHYYLISLLFILTNTVTANIQDSPHTPGNMHVLRFGEHEVSANTTPTTIG